jgi:transcription factor IIIB subunit 2
MDFDALFGPDNADGETVDDGYTYGGYNDDGAEAYNGIDDDFNF